MDKDISIRKAESEDFEDLRRIYDSAKKLMKKRGNPTQWGSTYPLWDRVMHHFRRGNLFVITKYNTPHGAFALVPGDDPTYGKIEGAWINDFPYATIHAIASDGCIKDIFGRTLRFSEERYDNIRIDTHHDNKRMTELIEKSGFIKCGIIWSENGTERVAFQKYRRSRE